MTDFWDDDPQNDPPFWDRESLPHDSPLRTSASRAVDIVVGRRLSEIRNGRHVSQVALAAYLNVPPSEIPDYERGAVRIDAPLLFRLAEILDVPLYSFFGNFPIKGLSFRWHE